MKILCWPNKLHLRTRLGPTASGLYKLYTMDSGDHRMTVLGKVIFLVSIYFHSSPFFLFCLTALFWSEGELTLCMCSILTVQLPHDKNSECKWKSISRFLVTKTRSTQLQNIKLVVKMGVGEIVNNTEKMENATLVKYLEKGAISRWTLLLWMWTRLMRL
jgi:hypothetical protein